MLQKTPADQLPADQPDNLDDAELMQALGREVASYIDERLGQERAMSTAALPAMLAQFKSDMMREVLAAIAAPKVLMFDDAGKPIGVKTGPLP